MSNKSSSRLIDTRCIDMDGNIQGNHKGFEYEITKTYAHLRKRHLEFPTVYQSPSLKILVEVAMMEYSMTQKEILEKVTVHSLVAHFVVNTVMLYISN